MDKKKIELLAPAKNSECAIAAILSGADAIYIGGPKFGARYTASNSLENLKEIISFAHKYWAKVYLTLNTLLKEEELKPAEKLIQDAYDIGIDAIILQDMGILEMDLPPIPLIASTQTYANTWQKVQFLEKVGFQRVILPREWSLQDIKEAKKQSKKIEMEFFVHGSLCVCYSGQCYMSYASGKRSGNRGDCAQPCRKSYSLIDAQGKTLVKNKYLLSLKDLNLSEYLGDLLEAGITSFKIEGRLKEPGYVKNIVTFYRQKLDRILEEKGYQQSSSGQSTSNFIPDPYKTFNRGYSAYCLSKQDTTIASPYTPKSWGEYIGEVKNFDGKSFLLTGDKKLANGDGICFLDEEEELIGTLVVKVLDSRIYPKNIDKIQNGRKIFRNMDRLFLQKLQNAKILRCIPIKMKLYEENKEWILLAEDQQGTTASIVLAFPKEEAKNHTKLIETIQKQLSKLGGSLFSLISLKIEILTPYFFPLSALNQARRSLLEKLEEARKISYENAREKLLLEKNDFPYPEKNLDCYANVINSLAIQFYKRHQVIKIEPSIESGISLKEKNLMKTRLCLKFQYGFCPKTGYSGNLQEPLFLYDGEKKYRLVFDCQKCEMLIQQSNL